MGWEEITPLETDVVTTQDKAVAGPVPIQQSENEQSSRTPIEGSSSRELGGDQGSFLEITDPNALLETWKPAEDGNGTILRFLDFGGTERTVSVRIPWLRLDHVWQTDAVERGQEAVSMTEDDQFHFIIHPHEIVTMRIVGTRK
jgi:alpha-mannosidase